MAESRERAEWGRFAALMALVANAHRDPRRSSPVRPERFNPYEGNNARTDGKEHAEGAADGAAGRVLPEGARRGDQEDGED